MWSNDRLLEFGEEKHKLLIFHHLMKTAGSTIQSSLHTESLDNFQVVHKPHDIERVRAMVEEGEFLKPEAFVFSGHMAARIFKLFPANIPQLRFTLFREPFSRFMSEASFRRVRWCELDKTFDHYLETLPPNLICGFLGSDNAKMAYAKLNQRFQYFGFLEDLPKLFGTIQFLMGFSGREFESLNYLPKSFAFSPTDEQRRKFEQRHSEDISLYKRIHEESGNFVRDFHTEFCPDYMPVFKNVEYSFTRSFAGRDVPNVEVARPQFEEAFNRAFEMRENPDENTFNDLLSAANIGPVSIPTGSLIVSKLGASKLSEWLDMVEAFWKNDDRDPLNVVAKAIAAERKKAL